MADLLRTSAPLAMPERRFAYTWSSTSGEGQGVGRMHGAKGGIVVRVRSWPLHSWARDPQAGRQSARAGFLSSATFSMQPSSLPASANLRAFHHRLADLVGRAFGIIPITCSWWGEIAFTASPVDPVVSCQRQICRGRDFFLVLGSSRLAGGRPVSAEVTVGSSLSNSSSRQPTPARHGTRTQMAAPKGPLQTVTGKAIKLPSAYVGNMTGAPELTEEYPPPTQRSATMRVSDVMTRDVRLTKPDETIQQAARIMAEIDAGVVPVSENDRLVRDVN